MPVGKLTIEVSIPHAQSLKDRRQVLRSLKARLANGFNASLCELNEGIVYNQATLAAAVISSSTEAVQKSLSALDEAAARIAQSLGAEVTDSYAELLD